jgi:hypothetical protein
LGCDPQKSLFILRHIENQTFGTFYYLVKPKFLGMQCICAEKQKAKHNAEK